MTTTVATTLESQIAKKQTDTVYSIGIAILGTGGISALPTPMLELPKQLGIAAADLALMLQIHQIWFSEVVSKKTFEDLMQEAGLASLIGGVVVYTGVKVTEGLLAEATNFAPVIGWIVSGIITGSVTGLVAYVWWQFCETRWRKLHGR
ncbi:MAG: hypothetical protein KF752_02800 [Pirellulaceae bacterium]|nr:hypothetical protein [Pirellulaceae bacterium]